ncbi:unnamed protein product [Citrullus colocynthis]|uniref:Uncharacterized protein n=1 Tax=Citrullus colocynthis TaxID=252529 RepID=A0ABP0YZ59_9ROSI
MGQESNVLLSWPTLKVGLAHLAHNFTLRRRSALEIWLDLKRVWLNKLNTPKVCEGEHGDRRRDCTPKSISHKA